MRKTVCLSAVVMFMVCPLALADFVDNGDGTVTDTISGLMWQQDTANILSGMTFVAALAYCDNLVLADYDDWRLPNYKELQSILDLQRYTPSIETAFFPLTKTEAYWSSTTSAEDTNNAWCVSFDVGRVDSSLKSNHHHVRAVRGGQ